MAMFAVGRGHILLLALLGPVTRTVGLKVVCDKPQKLGKTVYDFSVENIFENETISLNQYRGNVLAIVNVATY